MKCVSTTHLCIACCTAVLRVELWRHFATDEMTTVQITDSHTVFGLSLVAFLSLPRRRTIGFSARAGILAIVLLIIPSSLAREGDCVGRILKAVSSFDKSLSSRPCNMFLLFTLEIHTVTSDSEASNYANTVAQYSTRSATVNMGEARCFLQSNAIRALQHRTFGMTLAPAGVYCPFEEKRKKKWYQEKHMAEKRR